MNKAPQPESIFPLVTGLILIVFVMSVSAGSPVDTQLAVALFGIACSTTVVMQFWVPVTGSTFFLALFVGLEFVPWLRPFALLAPLSVAILTAQIPPLALAYALIFWVAGFAITPLRDSMHLDGSSIGIWAMMNLAGVTIGWMYCRYRQRQAELYERWEHDVTQHRLDIARDLHDSVAARLTSIVMRTQALTLNRDLDPHTVAQLDTIADESRRSTAEVRRLIHALTAEDPVITRPGEVPSIRETLAEAAEFGRSHGFDVRLTTNVTEPHYPDDVRSAVRGILREATINATKYAPPESVITIMAAEKDGGLHVSLSNVIDEDAKHDPTMSSGVGIHSMDALAGEIGATLSAQPIAGFWHLELDIPRPEAITPKRQSLELGNEPILDIASARALAIFSAVTGAVVLVLSFLVLHAIGTTGYIPNDIATAFACANNHRPYCVR